jgi:hypothetical protein
MERGFAEGLVFLIWPDLYNAATPSVSFGLPDGRSLSFSDEVIVLRPSRAGTVEGAPFDAVPLDWLADREKESAARKLAGWLGARSGGDFGVEWFDSGWSVWATREDGKILEVASFGYQLFDTKEDFLAGGQCQALHRKKAAAG